MASKTANVLPAPDSSSWMDSIGGVLNGAIGAFSSYTGMKTAQEQAKINADNNATALASQQYALAQQQAAAPTALSFSNLSITPTFLVIAAGGIFVLFNALKK